MHSTRLRQEHIHGVLLGVAVGEALGLRRSGLPKREALEMYGPPPMRYGDFGLRGAYGDDTRLMLINAQALLRSRSDLRSFRRAFQARLKWYPLSIPVGTTRVTLLVACKSWLAPLGIAPAVRSQDNSAAARAIFSALAMNGTGHRLARWTEESTKLTHSHPEAIEGCLILATLAHYAATTKQEDFDTTAALQEAIGSSLTEETRTALNQLESALQHGHGPSRVARQFGWQAGIDGSTIPTAIMAAYCWLRYPRDFRRAVKSAIALGGDSATMGAVVGGLVGAQLGTEAVPEELVERLGGFPQGTPWIKKLAERFSHWPHGPDDLHAAPALSSDPPIQLLRNLSLLPMSLWNSSKRLYKRLYDERERARRQG